MTNTVVRQGGMMTMVSVDPAPLSGERFTAMRRAMVSSQLRTSAVNDPRVVAAMAQVPREAFVPAEVRAIAYRDGLLPLVGGRHQNTPLATGRLLTEARIGATDHVLLVGAAGGYTAAVLSMLAQTVVALEPDPTLAALARSALADTVNVELVEGPLAEGWDARAPYDVLVIDGAVEQVPEALVRQLKPGGRAASGLIESGVTRLAAGGRSGGGFGIAAFADCECAILPGFARPAGFRF